MPETVTEDVRDHFTAGDRKTLIEIALRLDYLREDISEVKSNAQGLDERVRALENFRWWILGAAAAGGTIPLAIVKFFGH